jgi:hypothetical protein
MWMSGIGRAKIQDTVTGNKPNDIVRPSAKTQEAEADYDIDL